MTSRTVWLIVPILSAVLASPAWADPEGVRTGSLTAARLGPAVALLNDGRVLAAGGKGSDGDWTATAELYDPATGVWSMTGSMSQARPGAKATTLTSGDVLVTDGQGAETYHPASGTWTATESLPTPTGACSQTLLTNGQVLVVGNDPKGEVFNPATGHWRLTTGGTAQNRCAAAAVRLGDGRVLFAGGSATAAQQTAEIYDPSTDAFSSAGTMTVRRIGPIFGSLLSDGTALVASNTTAGTSTAERYAPGAGAWSSAGTLDAPQNAVGLLPLPAGVTALLTTDSPAGTGLPTYGFDLSTSHWIVLGRTHATWEAAPIALRSGEVLLVGGAQTSGGGPSSLTLPQRDAFVAFAPDTRLVSSSDDPASGTASFSFEADSPGYRPSDTGFECSLDRGPWSACPSPKSYSGLADEEHVFRVRARHHDGLADQTPVVQGFPAATYRQLMMSTSGLRGYWRLGDAKGSQTAKSEVNGLAGTYFGGPVLNQAGAFAEDPDGSAYFGGSAGATLPPLGSGTQFTIEGWTNLFSAAKDSPFGNNTLFGQWGTVRLIARPSGAYADLLVNGAKTSVLEPRTTSNLGQWVHWALVRNGSTLTMYRDGQVIASTTAVPSPATTLTGSIAAQAAAGSSSRTYFMHGKVDEVAVYTRALSAKEVKDRYLAGMRF